MPIDHSGKGEGDAEDALSYGVLAWLWLWLNGIKCGGVGWREEDEAERDMYGYG